MLRQYHSVMCSNPANPLRTWVVLRSYAEAVCEARFVLVWFVLHTHLHIVNVQGVGYCRLVVLFHDSVVDFHCRVVNFHWAGSLTESIFIVLRRTIAQDFAVRVCRALWVYGTYAFEKVGWSAHAVTYVVAVEISDRKPTVSVWRVSPLCCPHRVRPTWRNTILPLWLSFLDVCY